MFQYNRFWHFWHQLNNLHYFRTSITTAILTMILIPMALFFPPLWAVVIALPLVIAASVFVFTQLSNLFYNRQNTALGKVKAETTDARLKDEMDLYLNRRVVCPEELLLGNHLNLPEDSSKTETKAPLILEEEEDVINMDRARHDVERRNTGYRATGKFNQLYIKKIAVQDGLNEVAAREMAEILGFGNLIPTNTIKTSKILENSPETVSLTSSELIPSREKIKKLIDQTNADKPKRNIKNTEEVQNAVAKFVFKLKEAAYKAKKENHLQLLHIQKLIPDAIDGLQLYQHLFNQDDYEYEDDDVEPQQQQERIEAKNQIQNINIASFQKHFLLHLLLGSQDANPGNTLFTKESEDSFILHSIDHERIMPEDNYNVTKKTDFGKMSNGQPIAKDLENVFPIRLWLAGLPQADVPFRKEVMQEVLLSLNPKRMLAYHRQKNLFSPAAVGAQLDRIQIITKAFTEEMKKTTVTLTPKGLFLKLINNHPTYHFLKNTLELSDFHVFMLLGQVSEGADMSLLRHPLQWFPMKAQMKERQNADSPSEKRYYNTHACHLTIFAVTNEVKQFETINHKATETLEEISKNLKTIS